MFFFNLNFFLVEIFHVEPLDLGDKVPSNDQTINSLEDSIPALMSLV